MNEWMTINMYVWTNECMYYVWTNEQTNECTYLIGLNFVGQNFRHFPSTKKFCQLEISYYFKNLGNGRLIDHLRWHFKKNFWTKCSCRTKFFVTSKKFCHFCPTKFSPIRYVCMHVSGWVVRTATFWPCDLAMNPTKLNLSGCAGTKSQVIMTEGLECTGLVQSLITPDCVLSPRNCS